MTDHILEMSQTLAPTTDAGPALTPEAKMHGAARIDAPHVIDGTPSELPPNADADSKEQAPDVLCPEDEAALARHLRVQAAQLAEYLRTRQSHLDRREAQLNGQEAQLANDTRAARLWLAEAQAELRTKASELAEREQDMQRCLARLADVEKTHERRQEEWNARAAELAEGEKAIEEARRSLAVQRQEQEDASTHDRHTAADFVGAGPGGEAGERPGRGGQGEESGPERSRWEELRHQTEQLYRALEKDRREFDVRRCRHEQRVAAENRRFEEEIDRKRRELTRRSEELDRSRAAIVQLREEVGQMHRATLELRLAAEEVWARLAGAAPPAALVRELGEIRRQLAESYRDAGTAVAEQRRELVALRVEIRREHERLSGEKQRLEQWLSSQEHEIQQRAAKLVAREQQLDALETTLREQAAQWQMDRLAYQCEIDRLRAELKTAHGAM